MDPRDFLAVAAQFKNSSDEAERPTSIVRSYYALFNAVIGALTARGVIFRQTPDDHRTLISYLTKVRHRTAGSVGSALNSLRSDRNRADYELASVISVKTTEFVFQKASDALAQFDSISAPEMGDIVSQIQAIP
jgi:uncharacterized protein (UPF0332 family)